MQYSQRTIKNYERGISKFNKGQAAKAVAIAKAAQAINHNGLKGELRETVVHDLSRPLLPYNIGIGSGQIVSAENQTSKQMDVVVFDNGIIPPVLSQRQSCLFSVEAALLSIEVKSVLSLSELRKSHNAALNLATLTFAPPMGEVSYPKGHHIGGVIPYLLAFSLTLLKDNEIQRYNKILQGAMPSLHGICVVGSGFWFWSETEWIKWEFPWEFGELSAFVTAIVNRCQWTARTRLQPDMRNYLQ